jgi:DNA polymerase IV
MAEPSRRVAHLDMDAFYASVELLRRPELRGLPIAIGGRGDPNSRAVVTTATYEARQYGVHSGMSLYKASQLCKDLMMLPVDFEQYRLYSRRFKQAVLERAPLMEDRGIDEVYVELTDFDESSGHLAQDLRQRVFAATGLTCSIGIAPNKLLAKICSDLNKPNGYTILLNDQIPEVIWPLPVKRINGVGPKATERLIAFGIETIGDLAAADPVKLVKHFGRSYGVWLNNAAHGRDDRPLVLESEAIVISRETTFDRNLHLATQMLAIHEILDDLTTRLAADLMRKGKIGQQIGIKVKFEDFKGVTRDLTLRAPTNDPATMIIAAQQCLARVSPTQRIRLIGVRMGALSDQSDHEGQITNLDLF